MEFIDLKFYGIITVYMSKVSSVRILFCKGLKEIKKRKE